MDIVLLGVTIAVAALVHGVVTRRLEPHTVPAVLRHRVAVAHQVNRVLLVAGPLLVVLGIALHVTAGPP